MAGLWRPKNAEVPWGIAWPRWPGKAAKFDLDAILTEGDAGR